MTQVRVLWVTKGLGGGAGTLGVKTHFRTWVCFVEAQGTAVVERFKSVRAVSGSKGLERFFCSSMRCWKLRAC